MGLFFGKAYGMVTKSHTETSRRSYIPPSVSCWNGIQPDIRELDTFLSFHHALKDTCKVSFFYLER